MCLKKGTLLTVSGFWKVQNKLRPFLFLPLAYLSMTVNSDFPIRAHTGLGLLAFAKHSPDTPADRVTAPALPASGSGVGLDVLGQHGWIYGVLCYDK